MHKSQLFRGAQFVAKRRLEGLLWPGTVCAERIRRNLTLVHLQILFLLSCW